MGCYGPFIAEYLRNFPREQLLVLTLDEYQAHPKETLGKVFDHIGARRLDGADEWSQVVGQPGQGLINKQRVRFFCPSLICGVMSECGGDGSARA